MRISFRVCLLLLLSFLAGSSTMRAQQHGYPLTPVPFTAVRVQDPFWGPRIETNRTVTIPYAFEQCAATGRLRNFAVADSVLHHLQPRGGFCSRYGFDDSDVYKILEGTAYSLQTHPDPGLEAMVDRLIDQIARAQEPDGYLYTMRTIDPEKSWAKERWVNDRVHSSHELYNLGHLYEAAVAHAVATGKRSLLAIATKSADLLCATFGPGKMRTVPGHQGIEIGLAKLSLLTGRPQYLALAKFFLDERGHPAGSTDFQDHQPVVEQSEAVGHAVRAAYMYSGMADVAALTGDSAYVRAIDRIWDDVVNGKLYVTGGIGSVGKYEGFGPSFELPNPDAYCETCASIANVFWNYRMFLRRGDAKYLDVLERTLYNAFLSGVGQEGNRFFYPNPLESAGGKARSPWFACACCPSNIVRFLPSLPGYAYAYQQDTVFVNLYLGSSARVPLAGSPVELVQDTRYPWDGRIRCTVNPPAGRTFTLALRIPGWAQETPIPGGLYRYADRRSAPWTVQVNGTPISAVAVQGFIRIGRRWEPGDLVELDLPMPVRRIVARPEVSADRDRVALQHGPVMFCLEGQDNPGGSVLDLAISDDAPLRSAFAPELLGGVQVIQGRAVRTRRSDGAAPTVRTDTTFMAIPYFAWAHRGLASMTVWPVREGGHDIGR
jgi:DUF1680 family protein